MTEVKKSGLKPIGSRIIVKQDELQAKSGLIIPQGIKSLELTQGTIVAVGSQVEFSEVGKRIFYGRYSGIRLDHKIYSDGVYMLMNEEDILCLIPEDADV